MSFFSLNGLKPFIKRAILQISLLLVLTTAACGPRYQRIPVFEHRNLSVMLRAEVRDGDTVPRNFSHPATISSVRLAHVLSRLDVRMGERIPGSG